MKYKLFIFLLALSAPLAAQPSPARAAQNRKPGELWSLKPVIRPQVPPDLTKSANPIDAFIAANYQARGLRPVGPAPKLALLRRVYLDLIGIPPSPAEQDAFLKDDSPAAYEKVVDQLLASPQHGVRYARHWLDVLRYADIDERMLAEPGIHLWRDWVIDALNRDVGYDEFVRAQLTGYRSRQRTQIGATGVRSRIEPRLDDMFALGFLARGDVLRDGKETQELPQMAADTVGTAFMGMTVGCAKCHDHMYDPISQRDYYAMKALFDPLVVRKVTLASPAEIVAYGKALEAYQQKRAPIEEAVETLTASYRKKLYDDRVALLPADVRTVILKPERDRTPAEQKIADDYFPVLRIDSDKIMEVMPAEEAKKYKDLEQQLSEPAIHAPAELSAFWTVEVDRRNLSEPSFILTSGDPDRPEKDKPVQPGWPFAPKDLDFREGRIEVFSDWLTAPENPLFARVAVNRLWQWHFGEGLQKTASDFGKLGGDPSNPQLLDWLATEFVARHFSMKEMTRLMVTSDTYKLASEAGGDAAPANTKADPEANTKADPEDTFLWRFRLQRLEAEPVWDSILSAAGTLDLTIGGPSFDVAGAGPRQGRRANSGLAPAGTAAPPPNRRAAYMVRGFSTDKDVVPNFLQVFDVDDGRLPCPMRTQTVTAPQGLFMMNSDQIETASAKLAERLQKESGGNLKSAVDLGYRLTLARPPSAPERDRGLTYLANDPARLKGFAWLLYNLDEFIYVR
jgi:hypothetical protein